MPGKQVTPSLSEAAGETWGKSLGCLSLNLPNLQDRNTSTH